jgi:hypothetical protein
MELATTQKSQYVFVKFCHEINIYIQINKFCYGK